MYFDPGDCQDAIPLVSVIIPVGRREEMIAETVHSVLEQDWPAVQVVIVEPNERSTIGFDLRQRYGGQVEVVISAGTSVSAARNSGFMAAKGELLMTLDPGNLLPPKSISSRARLLQARPEVDVAYGRQLCVSDDNSFSPQTLDRHLFSERWPDGDVLAAYLSRPFFDHQDLVVRRSVLPKSDELYASDLELHADFLMIVRLLCIARFSPCFAITTLARDVASSNDNEEAPASLIVHGEAALSRLLDNTAVTARLGGLVDELKGRMHFYIAEAAWKEWEYRLFRHHLLLTRRHSNSLGQSLREHQRWLLSFAFQKLVGD